MEPGGGCSGLDIVMNANQNICQCCVALIVPRKRAFGSHIRVLQGDEEFAVSQGDLGAFGLRMTLLCTGALLSGAENVEIELQVEHIAKCHTNCNVYIQN